MEMEKSSLQENEPIPSINSFHNSLLTTNPSLSQFSSSNVSKKAKNKLKPLKGLPSNVRVGDWVCLICNNLNFSFRNECNRCQIQTKEQNQMQTMQISENQIIQNNKMQNRLPFQDLTNQNYSLGKTGSSVAHMKSKSTPVESELKLNSMLRMTNTQQASDLDGSSGDFVVNKGFKNMLLVTPPKHGQTKSFSIFKEYSDSGQKELPPYQSPKNLPSISPMLKRVFGYNMKDEENSDEDEYQPIEGENYIAQENKQAAISNPFRQPRKLESLHLASQSNQSSSENKEVFNFKTPTSINFEAKNIFE